MIIDPVPNTYQSMWLLAAYALHVRSNRPRSRPIRTDTHPPSSHSSSTLDSGFWGRSSRRFYGPWIVHSSCTTSHGLTTGISTAQAELSNERWMNARWTDWTNLIYLKDSLMYACWSESSYMRSVQWTSSTENCCLSGPWSWYCRWLKTLQQGLTLE